MGITSDNALIIVLLIAILLSVFFYITPSGIQFTGKVIDKDAGTTTAIVAPTAYINFTTEKISWGTGSLVDGTMGCKLNTISATDNCTDFSAVNTPLVLENVGNTNVRIQLVSNKNASAFIGGSGPRFQYRVAEKEGGSCLSNVGNVCNIFTPNNQTPKIFTNVNITGDGTTICPCLLARDARDSLKIDVEVFVPYNTLTGQKSAVFTAIATSL